MAHPGFGAANTLQRVCCCLKLANYDFSIEAQVLMQKFFTHALYYHQITKSGVRYRFSSRGQLTNY